MHTVAEAFTARAKRLLPALLVAALALLMLGACDQDRPTPTPVPPAAPGTGANGDAAGQAPAAEAAAAASPTPAPTPFVPQGDLVLWHSWGGGRQRRAHPNPDAAQAGCAPSQCGNALRGAQ